jgi:putative sigma-54 modulation protein
MAVELTGRNVTVTPAARVRAEKIVRRLERHLAGPSDVRVVVWREKHLFFAEAIATHRRRRWTAQEGSTELQAAVACALEKIDGQARKDTGKRRDGRHRGGRAKAAAGNGNEAEARALRRGSDARIVRSARLPVKPMSIEEAALAMDDARREFLVFRDASSERVTVLYKRRDGDLGLIVPED